MVGKASYHVWVNGSCYLVVVVCGGWFLELLIVVDKASYHVWVNGSCYLVVVVVVVVAVVVCGGWFLELLIVVDKAAYDVWVKRGLLSCCCLWWLVGRAADCGGQGLL